MYCCINRPFEAFIGKMIRVPFTFVTHLPISFESYQRRGTLVDKLSDKSFDSLNLKTLHFSP